MMLHRRDPNGPPCKHMEKLLQQAADGSSRGVSRWYALAHAARCGPCRRFLESLRGMISRLRGGRDADPPKDVLERLVRKIPKT